MTMAISAFDQRLYTPECPHCHIIQAIPLSRLRSFSIVCAACGHAQDLRVEPHASALKHEFSLAQEKDDEMRAKGESVDPAG
jgi:hypothetical protein